MVPEQHQERAGGVAHRRDDDGPRLALGRGQRGAGDGRRGGWCHRRSMAILRRGRAPRGRVVGHRGRHPRRGLAVVLRTECGAGDREALAGSIEHRSPRRTPAGRVDPAARILRVECAPIRAGLGRIPTGFTIRRRGDGAPRPRGGVVGLVIVSATRKRVGVSGGPTRMRDAVESDGRRQYRVHIDHFMKASLRWASGLDWACPRRWVAPG
jgi:hypothetical protein